MTTGSRAAGQRIYLFYGARDLVLYVFSLSVVGFWTALAFPQDFVRAPVAIGLLFLLAIFIQKHGARMDWTCFGVILRGLGGYPGRFGRLAWLRRQHIVRAALVYAAALCCELLCVKAFGSRLPWLLRPFPAATLVLVELGLVSSVRTFILGAQLLRTSHIRNVLSASPWRRELKGPPTSVHIFHAYVTGLFNHACLLMPAMAFWRFTQPTYVRELALLLISSLVFSPRWRASSMKLLVEFSTLFRESHEEAHHSRFTFTVLHGHHHDAIPSGLIGGPGLGFVEAIESSLCNALFLASITRGLYGVTVRNLYDMAQHQYIPGVFPYSRLVIQGRLHHVAHHYGSARPYSLGGAMPGVRVDIANGYEPDNAKVRWFLENVKKYEGLDEAASARFLKLTE